MSIEHSQSIDRKPKVRLSRPFRFIPRLAFAAMLLTSCNGPDYTPRQLQQVSGADSVFDPSLSPNSSDRGLTRIEFRYDPNYQDPNFPVKGALEMKTCFSGEGQWIIVSEQISSNAPGPGLVFKNHLNPYGFDSKTEQCRTTYPVTGIDDGEQDRVRVRSRIRGDNGKLDDNMRTYITVRHGSQIEGEFQGVETINAASMRYRPDIKPSSSASP
jgi:hypothetical protein